MSFKKKYTKLEDPANSDDGKNRDSLTSSKKST
jgi:hypothetical protein